MDVITLRFAVRIPDGSTFTIIRFEAPMKMSAFVRSILTLAAAVAIAAGAGSKATSAAQGRTQSGIAFVDLSTGGFEAVPGGRNVRLFGDIEGINFEPGECHPGTFFGLECVIFGDQAGQFTRLAPGGVAFTTCDPCAVGDVGGDPGDSVILKISYPPALPPQYPAGFTKFTFQHGTGALSGLSGQGTLDFSQFPPVATFTYRFSGRQ
jgi:hypothetical protein